MNRASGFEWHKGFKESRESVRMISVGGVRKSIHQSWLAKGLGFGLGLLCWGLREFRERFHRKRPALFKSGQWHFHQDNAPVHNSILVTDYLTKMGIKTVPPRPYSRYLAPCDFSLFLKLSLWDNWDNWWDERGYDEGHWHAQTGGIPWGLPEVVWTVNEVHCNRRRVFWRGIEFHVCTLNKSAHTKKVWK